MPRTTKKEVKLVFKRFCEMMGKEEIDWTEGKPQPGSWELDHSTVYGGYVITEELPGGGIEYPFGSGRLTPYNFVEAMRMASRAAYLTQKRLSP